MANNIGILDKDGAAVTLKSTDNTGVQTPHQNVDTLTTITNAVGVTNAVLGGATSDAAVVTDATGTIHQYLRGLVKLIVAKINLATVDTVTTITNAVGITNALLGGATSDAAVITDATGSIHQYLRGLVKLIVAKISISDVATIAGLGKGQGTMANSLPVAVASDQGSLPVKGTAKSVTATLTVTNGAYAVADVVGGLITFASAVSANGKSCILNSITLAGVAAIPYELWFFSADIATPRADNAVFGIAAADGAICLGVVPITSVDYYAGQTSFNNASVRGIGLQMQAGAATTSIYAYLKATAVTSPGTTTLYLTCNFEYVD